MPGSTSIGPAEAVARQLRRVRQRWNVHQVGRAVLLMAALGALTVALTVLLALRLGLVGFALAATAVTLGALTAGVTLVRAAITGWMRASCAAATVDARARLGGRLRTLVELGVHRPADDYFVPLLVEQNRAGLNLWRPEDLVPRLVPRGAVAGALVAACALVAVVALAPALAPRMPAIEYSEHPLGPVEPDGLTNGNPDRVVVGSGDAPGEPDAETSPSALAVADDVEGTERGLARLAAGLQDRIRERLWGEGWRRVAASRERAERARRPGRARPGSGGRDDANDGEGWEAARLAPGGATRRTRGKGRGREAGPSEAAGEPTPDTGETRGDAAAGSAVGHEAAAGAGTGTDPNLLGEPMEARHTENEAFALGLTAHVRGPSRSGRRPSGETPAAEDDERPRLGGRQRPETAVARIPIPAAYEALVGELFAHRSAAGGEP
jgi:hypothetical protein